MALQPYRELLHRCFRCGYCKLPSDYAGFNCPSYNRFRRETYSPGGRLWLIRAVAEEMILPSRHYADILYACTMCGNCRAHCCLEFKDEILDMMRAARAELVDASILPGNVQAYLENIYSFSNPWKKSPRKRDNWAKGSGIRRYKHTDKYLYYVGDTGSYHPRAMKVSRAIGELLLAAGISLGILGAGEMSAGNEARDMGETALFEYLRDINIALFQQHQVQHLITYSPHAFHVMTHLYQGMSDAVSVFHYLELMDTCLSQSRFHLSEGAPMKVAYHDSCFLGRWNGIYDLPRRVLGRIPGVERVEMEGNRENTLCCGGGNGNFFTDLLGGDKNSPSRVRVRQALSCGAEVIAVACPVCLVMLADAVESEAAAGQIQVKDIAEIIHGAFQPGVPDRKKREVRGAI